MLIKCPECELMLSDKALVCPHCGLPSKASINIQKRTPIKKRMRLPNGFGSITQLKNKTLRKPWMARKTVKRDADGTYILKTVGYYETYNQAYEALVEFNRNPYDLDSSITLSELYKRWSEEYFKTLSSSSSIRTVQSAWMYCTALYGMKVSEIRARHIKGIMEDGQVLITQGKDKGKYKTPSASTKSRIKSLFNLMLDYAVEYELTDKNYARTFEISDSILKEREDAKRSHISFSDAELQILWKNKTLPFCDMVLIQCYSGWRPQELATLKLSNIDLKSGIMIGGMKTTSGTNRTVPIHPAVRKFIENRYNEAAQLGSEYLFNDVNAVKGGFKMTYDKYAGRFDKIMNECGIKDHRPHDPRKTFVTLAKKYNVDEYAVKRIIGHNISDITEKVYTDRDLKWLIDEMNKIKVEE